MDQIQDKGEIENLVRSLSRHSEKVLLVLSGKSDIRADAKKIGPALICERLWKELGIGKIIRRLLSGRKFGFDVERAIFLTVLHRLFVSGSDRSCDRWHRDYVIDGSDALSLHHLYRAMAFLEEENISYILGARMRKSKCHGTCGRGFQATGVAIPPTIREVA